MAPLPLAMGRDDGAAFFEATSTDWRISNLRSAYLGILNDEAFEYELSRFQGLQEVKRQKTAAAAAKYSYDATLQNMSRVVIYWAVYTHIFFRLQDAVPFYLACFLARPGTDIPPLRWPFESWDCWLMRRLLLTPSIFMLLVATYFGMEASRRRMWAKYKVLALMALGGCIVIFFSLVMS